MNSQKALEKATVIHGLVRNIQTQAEKLERRVKNLIDLLGETDDISVEMREKMKKVLSYEQRPRNEIYRSGEVYELYEMIAGELTKYVRKDVLKVFLFLTKLEVVTELLILCDEGNDDCLERLKLFYEIYWMDIKTTVRRIVGEDKNR